MKTIEIASLDDLDRAAAQFLEITADHKKFAFHGAMGSGKTTLIKGCLQSAGCHRQCNKPHFFTC